MLYPCLTVWDYTRSNNKYWGEFILCIGLMMLIKILCCSSPMCIDLPYWWRELVLKSLKLNLSVCTPFSLPFSMEHLFPSFPSMAPLFSWEIFSSSSDSLTRQGAEEHPYLLWSMIHMHSIQLLNLHLTRSPYPILISWRFKIHA